MFIDLKQKVLVSKSFKTASSSFFDLLSDVEGDHIIKFDYHRTIKQMLQEYRLKEDKFTKITLIRNPWDYVVSAYFWAKYNNECPEHFEFEDFVYKDSEFNWKKQLYYWDLDYIDDVVKFEQFKDYSKMFCLMYAYPYKEPKRFKSGVRPSYIHYRDIHNRGTKDYIGSYFKNIIEAFEYEY